MHLKNHINIILRMLTLILVLPEVLLQNHSITHKIISTILLLVAASIDIWTYSPWNKRKREQVSEFAIYLIFIILGIFALLNNRTILILYFYFMVVVTAETMVKQNPTQKHIIIIQSLIFFCFFSVPCRHISLFFG